MDARLRGNPVRVRMRPAVCQNSSVLEPQNGTKTPRKTSTGQRKPPAGADSRTVEEGSGASCTPVFIPASFSHVFVFLFLSSRFHRVVPAWSIDGTTGRFSPSMELECRVAPATTVGRGGRVADKTMRGKKADRRGARTGWYEGTVRGDFGWANGRGGGASQAADMGGQKRRQAAAEAVVEVSGGGGGLRCWGRKERHRKMIRWRRRAGERSCTEVSGQTEGRAGGRGQGGSVAEAR